MPSPGRKPKYSTHLLLDKLAVYVEDNPSSTIVLADVARSCEIPYHIWRDNKIVREAVDKANSGSLFINPENVPTNLPNAEALVKSNWNNQSELIRAIQNLIDLINSLYDKALLGHSAEQHIAEQDEEIQSLKAKLRIKKEQIAKLNQEIDELYIKSESPQKRKDQRIKTNLITLTSVDRKQLSKNMADLKKEFQTIFGDEE